MSSNICNGENDCGDPRDWTDECECSYGDYAVRYCTNTGRCLAPWQLCDGIDDCGDGSDEVDCADVVYSCQYSPFGDFPCQVVTAGENKCISIADVCNGLADCSDGSDESFCHTPCANAHETRYVSSLFSSSK